jgi:hypothetical protein
MNTDTEGRKQMAESLRAQHPDIAEVVWKFNRWQHQVDYRGFAKNALVKVDPTAPEIVQEYGLEQETPVDTFTIPPSSTNRLVEAGAGA